MKNTFHVSEEVRKAIREIQAKLLERGSRVTPEQVVSIAIKMLKEELK